MHGYSFAFSLQSSSHPVATFPDTPTVVQGHILSRWFEEAFDTIIVFTFFPRVHQRNDSDRAKVFLTVARFFTDTALSLRNYHEVSTKVQLDADTALFAGYRFHWLCDLNFYRVSTVQRRTSRSRHYVVSSWKFLTFIARRVPFRLFWGHHGTQCH